MHPSQKFQRSLKFLRAYYKLIGQDVFADVFQRGKICYLIFFMLLTIISFYALDLMGPDDLGDSIRVAQASMLTGATQIPIKYYLLKDLRALRPVVAFLEDIYRKNSQPTDPYFAICHRYARITELILQLAAFSFAAIVAFIMLSGLIESYLTMKPAYCFYVPFIHEYSVLQVVLLDTFMGIASFFNVFVMPACDLFFYLVVANLTMIPLIIAMQMDELSKRLEQRQATVPEIKRRWMHYILIHQEYIRFLKLLNGCFYKFCIIQYLTATIFCILGISVVSKGAIIFLYGLALMGILQLGAYCALGTLVEHTTNRVYEAFFAVKWYELPVGEQRVYHLLLLHAQQPQMFYIAGVKPLNMETYLATLRMIYSYGMVFGAMI